MFSVARARADPATCWKRLTSFPLSVTSTHARHSPLTSYFLGTVSGQRTEYKHSQGIPNGILQRKFSGRTKHSQGIPNGILQKRFSRVQILIWDFGAVGSALFFSGLLLDTIGLANSRSPLDTIGLANSRSPLRLRLRLRLDFLN